MDFLDSVDVDYSRKKSLRVRSWYLYEQYKALERNQNVATEQLRDRVYQDRFLLQELDERRARRRMYPSVTQKELQRIRSDAHSSNDVFLESFCELQDEDLCVFEDEDNSVFEAVPGPEHSIDKNLSEVTSMCDNGDLVADNGDSVCGNGDSVCDNGDSVCDNGDSVCDNGDSVCDNGDSVCDNGDSVCSNGDSVCGNGESVYSNGESVCGNEVTVCNNEDSVCENEDEGGDCLSEGDGPEVDAFASRIELSISATLSEVGKPQSCHLAIDIKKELELVKKTIEENMNLQLENVKENQLCLDEFSKICVGSPMRQPPPPAPLSNSSTSKYEEAEGEDEYDHESVDLIEPREIDSQDDAISLWSRLVSFAYQLVQLNHGNCYYDYSSQFLTAVLACDVLRRGLIRMCKELTISNHLKLSRR